MNQRKYIKANESTKAKVVYTADDGRIFLFSGGTRTWRNQNPGNLVSGDVAKRNGQIGKAGGFAVFPDYEHGHAGLLDCLNKVYGNFSLGMLIKKFAPDYENDTERYLKFLQKSTGVYDQKKVKDFTEDEFDKLWRAIEKMEGWKEGNIKEIPDMNLKEISAVQKQKGTIESYHIEGIGWVSKSEGIALAIKGKVNAVVV